MNMKKHTYEFGYASNSYFNGSDGLVTRDDGESIRIRSDDGLMSVNVKDYSFGVSDVLDEETKAKLADLEAHSGKHFTDWGEECSYEDKLYERVCEQWWHDAKWMTTEDPERPGWAEGVYSAGRSGGWCVIEGTRWLAENFPSQLPSYPSDPERPFIVGITVDPETGQPKVLDAFADEDEAASYIGTLPNHEDGIYYIDDCTEQWEVVVMRDEFLALAFDLVENIDHLKKGWATELIEEDFAELEERREANTIRSITE